MLCFNFDSLLSRKKKQEGSNSSNGCTKRFPRELIKGLDLRLQAGSCNRKVREKQNRFSVWSGRPHYSSSEEEEEEEEAGEEEEVIKERRKREFMANKVSHLIHRVASTCLLAHPLPGPCTTHRRHSTTTTMFDLDDHLTHRIEEEDEEEAAAAAAMAGEEEEAAAMAEREGLCGVTLLVAEVFEAVSAVKRAYVTLQAAHNPWDPDGIRLADAAVVAELRKLGRLRDRFTRKRGLTVTGNYGRAGAAPLREAVAPYEAALEELKRELKAKDADLESLREKLRNATPHGRKHYKAAGAGGRLLSSKRVGCSSGLTAPTAAATPELFEVCMEEVRSACKSFAENLLSLMRGARWDISAAVRSMLEGGVGGDVEVEPHHARHALESYVMRKMFHGFENESFYMEGSLASLLQPAEYRRDSFAQFKDMRGMDPAELLGVLPTCQLGRFAGKKYLAVVHARMEESLFGGVEQRRQVLAGAHPRTGFYGDYFLRLAKAVWLLHLLAFALEPPPSHFEASKGADFHPDYMESVVRFAGGRVPAGWVVGFPVGPGFKLGNGTVVRARVYLIPNRTEPNQLF